ncbi:MAG: hypothetical protein HYR60_09285, partial [Acidobacteria bacterium]|nr:hypothetical protein [Acidobacteriota bacterium]
EPVRGPVLVRQLANPWAALDPAAFVERPNRLELAMLGNEYESAALAVTNLQTRAADFRIAAGPELKNAVQFREAPLVLPDSIGFPSEDVLPLLGEGQTLRLGPGETRKLWLTFHSRDLPPGEIRSSIRIGDLASQEPPLDAPVVVKVYRTRLPDRLTYRHCNWLYLANISDRAVREAVMRDALEHGTNVFNVPGCSLEADAEGKLGKARTEVHDELVANLRGRAFFLINGSVGLSWPAGAKISREVQDRAYAEALRWYAGHMRSLGVDYAGYAFYLQDEPGLMGQDAGFDQWVEQVKRVKAADARLQIYANPAGGAHAEVLAPVAGLIDVWQPDLHLLRDQPEELGRIFRQGKQYWHYEAPADQRNLHPLGFYRMKPWVAFQLGMTGGGYWVYSGSPYWFFDPGRSTEYGAVYLTDKGPVTTKRWEASRDGAEDFELLWMLRQKARRANSREALRLLDEAVAFVTKDQEQASDIARQLRPYAPDYSRWMEYREKLIRMLETLE